MIEQSRRTLPFAPILIGLGAFGSLVGMMVLASRYWLAQKIFGARLVFGMAWDSVDSLKVSMVALQGLWLVFLGGGLVVTGLILYVAPLRHHIISTPQPQPRA